MKMTELERQNGDLRRQLDQQLYALKTPADVDDDDNAAQLSRDELARRYCNLSLSLPLSTKLNRTETPGTPYPLLLKAETPLPNRLRGNVM